MIKVLTGTQIGPRQFELPVGLLPFCATTVIERAQREKMPKLTAQFRDRVQQMPELRDTMHPTGPAHYGVAERGIIGLVNPERLRRILTRMLDENEFLSPYGIRSLSRYHAEHPYIFTVHGQEYRVATCRRRLTPACLALRGLRVA